MAASMRNPVVIILGATGTGKTKLSLEIAKVFNGEIISADAMQIYKGLDIITNKATHEERQLCPHHMIDYLSPLKDNSTVVEYRNQAVPLIDSLLSNKKTPVVVGGTNYYIESLLWKHLVNSEDVKRATTNLQEKRAKFPKLEDVSETVKNESTQSACSDISSSIDGNTPGSIHCKDDTPQDIEDDVDTNKASDADSDGSENDAVMSSNREKYKDLSSPELYQRLCGVDPASAYRLHPKDRRKVLRALEVFDQHGIPMSEVYKAQHSELSDKAMSGPLRYSDTCIFWLQCDKEVLEKRLDDRVDKMLEMGLVEELKEFHKQYNDDRIKQGKKENYSTGIFQSIGFKEFHEYLILSDDERLTENGQKLLEIGIENLKLATRKYARYQNRWVNRRLLRRPCKESVPAVYGLDCTDVSRWEELVSAPATSILTALRKGEESPVLPIPQEAEKVSEFQYNECKVCDVVTVTKFIWEEHLKSRRHKKALQHYRKLTNTLDIYVQQKQSSQSSPKDS